MKIIYVYCGEETNMSDPRSYEHNELVVFFSGLISTTSSVVFIAARIAYTRFEMRCECI